VRHIAIFEVVVVEDRDADVIFGNTVHIGLTELPSVRVVVGGGGMAVYL
jgi:hypothetical protein